MSEPELVARGKAIAERLNAQAQAKRNGSEPPPPEPPSDEDDATARDVLQKAGMISAAALDSKIFPPLQWHVPGLVPEGFGLLVAPPKAGKSWMVASVGLACSMGGKAFGSIEVEGRPVLYMALEDGHRRLKDRHRLLVGDEAKLPETMMVVCDATPLTAPAIIAAFLEVYGRDRPLIIVDTLVRIRPVRRSGEDPYQFDYGFASMLKTLVDAYPGAGLWAVHHSRKATAEDFVDAVSGTNGLAGAADHILVLKHPRLAMHGSLLVTGRDVPEGEYGLISDQGRGWRLDGDSLAAAAGAAETRQRQDRLGDRALEVVKHINDCGDKGATPAQLAEATGIDPAQIGVYLKRLTDAGAIWKAKRGLYRGAVSSVSCVSSDEETYGTNTTNNLFTGEEGLP